MTTIPVVLLLVIFAWRTGIRLMVMVSQSLLMNRLPRVIGKGHGC